MLFGNNEDFAIEIKKECDADNWVLGKLSYWVLGHKIEGVDSSVDLKGCINWHAQFANSVGDFKNDKLYNVADPHTLYGILEDLIYYETCVEHTEFGLSESEAAKFEITHLGMSSFESAQLRIFMVESGTCRQKIIWGNGRTNANYAVLKKRTLQKIANEFVQNCVL